MNNSGDPGYAYIDKTSGTRVQACHALATSSVRPKTRAGLNQRPLVREEVETKILTDIFGIKLVNANKDADGCSPQSPSEGWAKFWELARMYVVRQEAVKLVP